MAEVIEATAGKIRDLPISTNLKALLKATAEATGIARVTVTSGGQCKKGTCTKRTGSTRHDSGQAADLQLQAGGRTLDFTVAADLPKIVAFVKEAARSGATGIGAGLDYMGPKTLHIGFGPVAVWGAGGKAANAPQWIIDAARAGWASAGTTWSGMKGAPGSAPPSASLDSDDEEEEDDYAHAAAI